MDSEQMYSDLPRRKLQLLCKQAGLRANATNKEMAEALSKLAKAKPSDQIDGPDSMTPAEPKPCMEARLEGSIPDSSEVAVGSKDAAASEDSQQKGQEVISKPEDSSQESEPEPGSIMQCDALEPLLVEGRPEAEHVRRSDVSKGLEVENEKDLLPAVGKEALEDDVETKNSAQDGEYSRAAGKDNVGGLVQELLLAEASGATAGAGAHRGLVKKTHIGQKGREDRLKRAAEKGTVERSTLLAEKRGGGFQSLGQPTSFEATKEAAHDPAEPHGDTHPDEQPVQLVPAISPAEETDRSEEKVVTEGLLRANLVEGEESVQKDGVGASEGKVVFREGVPGTGAEDESVEQDEPEAEKENDPPARTSETHKTEADKPVKPCPGDELHETEPDSGVAGGSLLPLGVTLAGSLLAEEDRSSGGQPTHKRCYKSKPFSAPGVEKRVLAAAKKGASQRDAILAEKRNPVPR